jgi:hypothetical protein
VLCRLHFLGYSFHQLQGLFSLSVIDPSIRFSSS